MMREEAYRQWRAAAGPWAQWLKPSLIADAPAGVEPIALSAPNIGWMPPKGDTAIVVDLPAVDSVQLGVALNAQGYCPVPLFNTTYGVGEVVNTWDLAAALIHLAHKLLPQTDGPPVFLLDRYREAPTKFLKAGDFDNRWYIFASDFPTEARLREAGIRHLVVASRAVASDLSDALARHAGLAPLVMMPDDGATAPFPKARAGVLRGLSTFGRVLHKNFDGSFGHRISQG
jgi:hypothetical protein